MRDFGAAIGLVFAIEGLLMAGFTELMRKRMAAAAREDPTNCAVSASRPRLSALRSSGPLALCCNRLKKTRTSVAEMIDPDSEEDPMNEAKRISTRRRRARSALALAVASALVCAPLALAPATPAFAQARPTNLADLVDLVAEAVVNISATQTIEEKGAEAPDLPKGTPFDEMFEEFFKNHGINPHPRARQAQSLGSGFVIDSSGIVITNNHVVGDANDIVVIFTTAAN